MQSQNYMPWFVMAVSIAGVLYWKGYIKIPASWKGNSNPTAVIMSLEQLAAHDLGIAFVKAAKREADHAIANLTAADQLGGLIATFQAPFVQPTVPPAAGQNPNQAATNK